MGGGFAARLSPISPSTARAPVGIRLAREQRLVHEAVPRFEHSTIRRDEVPGREQHDVAGNQIRHGELHRCPVPQRGHPYGHRLAQPLGGPPGAVFLDGVQDHAQQDHAGDDRAARDITGQRGEGAGGDQQDDQGVTEAGRDQPEQRALATLLQHVRADLLEPSRGFSAGETGRGCGKAGEEGAE